MNDKLYEFDAEVKKVEGITAPYYWTAQRYQGKDRKTARRYRSRND